MMRRFLKEIQAVGLRDWLWFVVRLRRNEFHPSLNRWKYEGLKGIAEREKRRARAHRIDMVLMDLKYAKEEK